MTEYTKTELRKQLCDLQKQYDEYWQQKLKLDMSRGKPAAEQLDISMPLLGEMTDWNTAAGLDVRNYGILEGIPECRELFSELLEIPAEQILIGGNASLNLMFDTVASHCLFGTAGQKPWMQYKWEGQPVKFLCPVPGYDRHFAICEELGIEMIPVPLNEDGPDMETVRRLAAADPLIKGIWCVPLHANPEGVCYSDAVVRELVSMETAAADFRIFWDNAYGIHHVYEKVAVLNVLEAARECGNENRVYYFFSTSKITFPGAGIAVMATGADNLKEIRKHMSAQTIGHDKINQLRHVRYFGNAEGIRRQMDVLAEKLRPKFDIVLDKLENQLGGTGLAKWSRPKGGYFISLHTLPGCAKEVVRLAKAVGVVLTGAGATYPYGKDPSDSNIRIALSYPTVAELDQAMDVLVTCVKIAGIEQILANQKSA